MHRLNLYFSPIVSVAACPVAKKRKLEETSTRPSTPKDVKPEIQTGSRNKRGKSKDGTKSENGKTPKMADSNKDTEMVEVDIEKLPVVKEEEEETSVETEKSIPAATDSDLLVPAVEKTGESTEQITVDIKVEKTNAVVPPIEIKTEPIEPQETDCFKEAEQAIRRLSSAGNEDNVTYSVEMVNAGPETVYVKHEVEAVEMIANTETQVAKDEPVTDPPNEKANVAEDTGDIFSQIEAQCAQIQKNESERTELDSEQGQNATNLPSAAGLSKISDRVSPQTIQNLLDNSLITGTLEMRSKSPELPEGAVVHNVETKDAVVRLRSREEVMKDVADIEKSDDEGKI